MTRRQKMGVAGLCVLMVAGGVAPVMMRGRAAGPATTGAGEGADAAATQAAVDAKTREIMTRLVATQTKIREVMPSLVAVGDADFRKEEGAKLQPLLKAWVSGLQELENATTDPENRSQIRKNRYEFMALAIAVGDTDAQASMEKEVKDGSGADQVLAQSALTLANWIKASKDAAAQAKLLEGYVPVVKANVSSDVVASMLGFMSNVGAANVELSKQAIDVFRQNLKGPGIDEAIAQLDAQQGQREQIGKTLAVEGRTTTGGKFNVDAYKGKVVLVDFWATWCIPCVEFLPQVQKVYADFHDQGLEIVGVDWDYSDSAVNKFTEEKKMPWVQLREESQTEESPIHPIGKRLGIDGIPTVYLVDKKGVLRYIDGEDRLAGRVKELLAEK